MTVAASPNPDHIYSHEPTLADLVRDLWAAKWVLLISGVVGMTLAYMFLMLAVPQYKVSLLVGPAERSSSTDIQALMPENSSFVVQYLVNTLGSQDSTDFMRFENILRERTVAEILLQDSKIMAGVMADKEFTIAVPDDLDNSEALSAYLQKAVQIESVGSSPLKRLIYMHPDREFAEYFLTKIRLVADNLIKDDIRQMTEKRATYLRQKLKDVSHPDHQNALTSMLMEQEHIQMILAIDEPFAAKIVEPAYSAPRPYWPRPALHTAMIILGVLIAGYILRSLVITIRHQGHPAR